MRLLLVLLALVAPAGATARAEPFTPGQVLSQPTVEQVTSSALAFMAPRTLDAIPVWQMAMWGLRGLTTLDARLTPDLQPNGTVPVLRLIGPSKVLVHQPAPPPDSAEAWGMAVGQMARVAWDSSGAVRRAGTQGILRGFFDELFNHLDPYSRYATPAEAQAERARRIGRASVGIHPALRRGAIVVGTVQPGSSAWLAGVRPGERIVTIDGEPTRGADLQAINALLAGPDESLVGIGLRGQNGTRSLSLRREALPPETVTSRRLHDMLVVRIGGFASNTAARLGQELIAGTAARPPPAGVVIDLRGNRGGLLYQAVAATAMLQPVGIVATSAGRHPQSAHEFRADGRDLADGLPVVVVVDGRSASSAEVMAAALADQRRAVVVGSTTLGKGLVQTITPLPDGGELFVTWSRLLAPRGWPIQGLGVVPQLCTSLGRDALARNLAALERGEQPLRLGLERHRAARAPLPAGEILEIRAICPAAEGGEQDLAAAQALIRSPVAYAAALLAQPTALSAPSPSLHPVGMPQGLTSVPPVRK